jgi:biotin synthase
MPFDGTPYENTWDLDPTRCLKILAMARFVCPDREVRIAGGREMHLRSLQGLALHVANSIFLGDYLTSEGQAAETDLELIRDNGFVVLGSDEHDAQVAEGHPHDPAIRRRGAGTDVAANA